MNVNPDDDDDDDDDDDEEEEEEEDLSLAALLWLVVLAMFTDFHGIVLPPFVT